MNAALYRKIFFYGFLLTLWHGLYQAKIWPEYLFPSPADVGANLWQGLREQSYIFAILASFRRLLIGYGLSVVLGLPLGILLARYRWLEQTLGSLVLGLQTLPSICWLPLAILWFGLSDSAIIFVVVIGSLLSVTIATKSGIQQVAPLLLKAARTMGAEGVRLYRYVILPAALPTVMSGLKQGWSFAWRSLMAGELLFVNVGLGHLLDAGRELNDMSQVIAVIAIIVVLGWLTDRFVFASLERKIAERWGFH